MQSWEPGKYWQTIRVNAALYGVRVLDAGSIARPSLRVSIFSDREVSARDLEALKRELTWRFDLDADLRAFERTARKDDRFRAVFRRWRGTRDSSQYNLYELLVVAVLLQNAVVRRTVQMMTALLDAFGTRLDFDSKRLFAIWRPEDLDRVSEQELRALKVGYRAKFLKRLSGDFARKVVDEEKLRTMDRESARKELLKLYGVGPETARILLYPACHRYGPMHSVAPWDQKIYSRLLYDRTLVSAQKIVRDLNRRYGDHAPLAAHYIWEDAFWRHKRDPIPWLAKEIRL